MKLKGFYIMKINRNFYLLLLVGEYVKYSTALCLTSLTSFYSFRWCCHLWLRGNSKAFLINLLKQLAIIYIPFRKLEGKEETVPKDIMQIPPKRHTSTGLSSPSFATWSSCKWASNSGLLFPSTPSFPKITSRRYKGEAALCSKDLSLEKRRQSK